MDEKESEERENNFTAQPGVNTEKARGTDEADTILPF